MKYIFTIPLFLLLAQPLMAEKLSGPQIAQKSFALEKPDSLYMKVLLHLISSKNAKPRIRHIEVLQQEVPESRQFIEFIGPQDVAGTKFLSSERDNATETRMFSPGDGKNRVINSRSKKNSFMGTDLSYYDLERHDFDDFHFTMQSDSQQIKDKSFSGRRFYVVAAVPKNREAPYHKMLYWIDQETFQVRRIEALISDVKVKDIYILKNLEGIKYFIPEIILAINYQKGAHRTVWLVQEQEVNPSIEERVFSLQNLN